MIQNKNLVDKIAYTILFKCFTENNAFVQQGHIKLIKLIINIYIR